MGGRAETPGLFGGFFASSQAKVGFIRGASGTREKLALRCTYTIDLGGCLDIPAAASPRRYHRSCRSHLVRSDGDSSTETNDVRDIAGPLTLSFLEPGREGGEERSLAQLRLRTPRDGRSRKRWEADREAAALDVHRECVSSFPSRCTPIRRLFDVGEYVTIEAVRTPAQAHPGDDEKETFCSSPSCTPSRAPCEPVAISRSSAGMLLSALSLAVTELQLQDRESLEDVCQQRLLSSLSQIKQDKELQRGDRVQTSVAPDDSSESSADSAGLTPSRAPKPMPWNLPVFAVMDADEELFLGSYIASASLYNQEFVLPCNQREPSSSGGGAAAEKGLEAMAERRNKGGETSPCAAGHKNANERDSHSRDGRKETFGATARAEDSPGWKRALSTRLTSLDELWHWEFFGFNVVRRKGQSVGLTGFFNYLACAVGLGTPPALLCPFDRRRQKALLRVLRERTRVSLRSTYFVAELPVRPSRPLPFPRSSTAAPSAASHERGAVGAAAHRDALEAEREGEWHSIWEFGLRDLWRSADFSDSEGELTQPAARCGSRRSQGSAAGGIDAAEEVSSDMREAWMTPREGEDDNAAARMNARDSGETPSLAALSGGASLGGSAAAHAGGFIHKDLLIRLSITGPDPYASLHFCRALPSLPLLSYRSTDSNAADLSCFTGLYDEQRGPLGPPGALPFVCTLRLTTQRHALERIRGLQCLLRAETPCFPPASGYSERDGLPQPPREKNLTERTRPQLRPQLGEEAQRSVGSRQGDGLLRGDDEEMNRTEGQTVLHAKGRFCSHLGFLAALAPLLAPIPPPRTPDGLFPFGPPSLAASPAAEADLRRSILSVLNPQQHEVTLPFPLTARLFGLSLLLGQALEISEGFLGADAEDRSSSDFPGKRRRDKPLLDETFSLAFPPTQSSESEQPPSHEGGPRPAFLQPRQLERPAGQHAPAGAYVCGRCEESEEEELSRADKPRVRRAAEIDCSSAPPLKGNAGALRSLARPTRGLSPQAASPVAACAGGQDEADTSPADGRHLGWSVAGIAKRAGRERVSRRAEEDTPARPPSAWAIPSPFCPPDSAGDRGAFSWVGGEIASAASQPSDGLCRGPSSGSGEEARMRRAVKRLLRPSHPDDHKAHLLRQARKLAVLAAIENGGDAGVSSRSGTTDAARAPKVPRGVPDDPHSGPACSASCPSPSSPHSPNRAVFLAFSLLCRGAPSNSLLTDLALAVAGLPSLVHVQRFWSLFLVALRGAWEARTLLPRVSSAAHPSPCPPGFQPQRAPCAGSAAGAQGSSSKARAPNAHGDRDATVGWEGGLEERNAQDSRKGRREDRGEFSPESKSGSPGHKSSWWRFSSSSLARTLSASLAVQTREGWNPASSLGSSHDSSHADLVATNALLSPSSGFFFDASGCNFSSPSPSPGRAAKAAAAAAVAAGASCAPDGPVGLPDFRGCLLLQHLQQLNCAIQQLRVLAWEAEGRPRSWAVGSGGGLRQAGASCGTRKDLCREERGGRAMLAGEDAAPLQSETQGEVGPFESHRFLAWTGQRTRKGEGVSEGRHRNPHDTGDPLPVVLPGMPPVTEVTLGLHRARLNAQKLLYIERNGGKRSGDSHETDLFPFARACRNAFERALTGYGEQLQGGASSPKGLHVRSSPLSRTFPSFSEWCVRELGPLLLSRCDLSAIADRQELLLDVRRAAFAAARQKSAQLLGASGATPPKKPVEGRLSEATRGHPARLSSPAGSREGVEDAAAGLEGEARIGRDAAASAVASAAALAAEETACEGLRVKQEEEEAQKNAHGDRVRRAERMWREAVHKGGRSKRVESRGPFFDAVVEGEMALHYLESISAVDLLQQLVCCLVTGAVETWLTSCACSLLDAAFGGLRPSLEETARKEAAVQTVACLAGCRHFLSASSTHMPLHSSSAAAASPRFPPCVFLPLLSAVLELQRQAVLQLAAAGSRSARDSLRASHEPMNRVSDAGDVFSPFALLCTPAVFAAFLHCELTASRASSLLQKFDRYGENLPRASLGGVPLRGETLLGGAALQLSERVLSQHLRQAREAAGTAQSSRTERADPNRYSDAIELEGLGEDAEVPVLGKEEVSSVMFYVKDCQKAASGSWGPEEGAETPLDSPGDWWGRATRSADLSLSSTSFAWTLRGPQGLRNFRRSEF
ncbi:hypothetical protein BESB_002240 [Besnoitia besnoiti]|uniref:Uncharacterized protein n=1 Tax=Besnoitia besnoiti TaxID=94643 RepID=A0A2A9MPB7_BESBE|nr:hypothetical protein BESB_002240 [Besnoitia besnoiti]PFH37883.1 hypothetical protein BESB_002240 [Besnoitia besnoiti]